MILVLLAILYFFPILESSPVQKLISPLVPLHPLEESKKGHEIFGFAPHWNISKLDNIDFDALTTLAYFGVPIKADGGLNRADYGYKVFKSRKATDLFKEAHAHGTRAVLTITQMDNASIRALLDSQAAQEKTINEAVEEVQGRGIDGINVDIEYVGNPGLGYREKFTKFVKNLSDHMHAQNPNAQVSVSVYAASAKDPKLYDIKGLAEASDLIFMMAYDFASYGADHAMPTAPLYGYKEGKYWYDISTAVEDFLAQMPASKLVLGLPWYGYDYAVGQPEVKAATKKGYYYYYKYWYRYRGRLYWKWRRAYQKIPVNVQTYKRGIEGINPAAEGWDDVGKVGWRAYREGGSWRMFFLDDERSLAAKYKFAKESGLRGVGIWALGFDEGRKELWTQLRDEFGIKVADHSVVGRIIAGEND